MDMTPSTVLLGLGAEGKEERGKLGRGRQRIMDSDGDVWILGEWLCGARGWLRERAMPAPMMTLSMVGTPCAYEDMRE